jgi:hypothetical protein
MVSNTDGGHYDIGGDIALSPVDDDDNPLHMDQAEGDLTSFIMSATLIRGQIRCKLSTIYQCGYEIRPIIWFVKRTPQVEDNLKRLGLEYRDTFVRTQDISKLCHAYRRYFNLSNMENQLKMVDHFNGILPQPHNHEEVEEIIDLLDEQSESLRPPSPSDESRKGSEQT